jgi:hypothetical protein
VLETPSPMPRSITESVLGEKSAGSAAVAKH